MKILKQEFYNKLTTIDLTKSLLGKVLVREVNNVILMGRISETEAYLYNDPASHSFKGQSARNKSMFEEAGTAYVYFIYGVYYCFNVVSGSKGIGEAVLIRSLEPMDSEFTKNQLNGPGKICREFKIDRTLDSHKLWKKPLYIMDDGFEINKNQIISSKRIGITKAREEFLRFEIANI